MNSNSFGPSGLCVTFLAVGLFLGGCAAHHQRMVDRTEWLLQANRHREALDYLERYLGRHAGNEEAWRYRIRIRLELEQRAAAGAEYWRMQTALGRSEPELLHHVVFAHGGGWTTDDFVPLARCGPDSVGNVALFEAQLLGRQAAPGSDIYLAPRQETVIGVMDALPGRFGAAVVPLLRDGFSQPAPEARLAAARAAVRLLDDAPELATPLVQEALGDPSRTVRRGTVEVLLAAGDAVDVGGYEPMPGEADPGVAVGWLALAERMGEPRRTALTTALAAAVPFVAAWSATAPDAGAGEDGDVEGSGARETPTEGPVAHAPPGDDPLVWLAWSLRRGDREPAACLAEAPFEVRRSFALLVSPVLPLEGRVLEALAADPDMVVRTSVARYLVNGCGDGAVLGLLDDPEQGVRMAAARALAESGDPAALEVLSRHFEAGGLEERLALLDAMLPLAPNPFLPVATSALGDELALVRESAVAPVASSCSEAVGPALFAALTDEDPHVVVRAATALYPVEVAALEAEAAAAAAEAEAAAAAAEAAAAGAAQGSGEADGAGGDGLEGQP